MKPAASIKPYFIKNRLNIALGLAALIGVDFLQLLIPRVIKWAVDDLTALRIDYRGLFTYALYIVGLALMIAVLRYFWRRYLIGLSRQIEEGLRNQLFSHIQTLSAPYFSETKTGDLMAHATNDIQHIRMATGMGIVAFTDAVVLGTAAIGFMAYINVRLTLYVLIPMPLIALSTRFFTRKMHQSYQAVQASFADMTETVRERFEGIRVIKAYNREKAAALAVEGASRTYITQNLKLARMMRAFFPIMILFSNMSLGIVIFLGGRQTIRGGITTGDFVAFISYIGLLTWPMMATGWVINLIQRGRASLDRLNRILQTIPSIKEAKEAAAFDHAAGEIRFEQVAFGYKKGPAVLDGIDLTVKRGQTLGIVGPPGSGKTTLANLIPRLFDVESGSIRLDGRDIRNLKLADLRRQISFVPQEPFLFSGTIRENITFGQEAITEAALEAAMHKAALYRTVNRFPKRFETVVGEKGVVLSGGQKQRVALARALLNDTPILILDDPVSQVDMETGAAIIRTLQSFQGQKTLVIISHRLAALQMADHIIVLKEGRIEDQGTHAELMQTSRYYAQSYRFQEIEEEFDAA